MQSGEDGAVHLAHLVCDEGGNHLMRVAISLMRGCNRATHLVCEGFEGLLLLRDPTAPTSTLRKHSRVVALDGDAALQMINLHLERFTLGLHERASVGKLGT